RGRAGPKMVGDSETSADCAGDCAAAAMVLLAFLSVWLAAQSQRAMAPASSGHRTSERKRARAFRGGVAVVAWRLAKKGRGHHSWARYRPQRARPAPAHCPRSHAPA